MELFSTWTVTTSITELPIRFLAAVDNADTVSLQRDDAGEDPAIVLRRLVARAREPFIHIAERLVMTR